jgi:anti-sigma factor RsiW
MSQRDCPTHEELTAFALGELPDADVDAIAEHLEGCPDCERMAQEFDNLTDSAIHALRQSDLDLLSSEAISSPAPHAESVAENVARPPLGLTAWSGVILARAADCTPGIRSTAASRRW